MKKFARLPASQLKLGANVRSDLGDEAGLKLLGHAVVKHQQSPVIVRPDYTVLDGYRRLEGLRLISRMDFELDVIITDEPDNETSRARFQLISAVHRKGLTLHEKCEAVQLLVAACPNMTNKQLAEEELFLDATAVTQLRSYEKLIPAARQAVKEGKLSDIIKMYNLSQLTAEKQAELLPKAIKLSRSAFAAICQKAKNGEPETESGGRATKIKVPLPSGQVVTVVGEEISLDDALETLGEASKALKAAIAKGLNAKTAMAVWADVAKAGG